MGTNTRPIHRRYDAASAYANGEGSPMTTAWSRHGFTLAWREDEWGNPERALYLGRLRVGSVMQIRVAKPKQFRAWIQDSEEGLTVGWFATEQEARDALVSAVLEAMRDG